MRISTLVFAAVFACAMPAMAQTVIELQGREPGSPQAQDQASPPAQGNVETQTRESSQPPSSSRYSFNRVDNGFLRLDNSSGQIAFCSQLAVGWACQTVPEDRAALENEIARLQGEVVLLKKEIATLKVLAPPRPLAELVPPAHKNGEVTSKLPTKEEIERARAAIESAWRRLVDMLVNFQKDMMRKG